MPTHLYLSRSLPGRCFAVCSPAAHHTLESQAKAQEAIQEYNADLPHDEQFAITGSILRQITKVKPGKMKEWSE